MRGKIGLVVVALSLALFAPARTDEGKAPDGFEPLFNGQDLTGWKVYDGKMSSWGVDNGLLFTTGEGGGWLMTEKEYADFELRLEYKVPKGGNSGVALRAPLAGNPAFAGMEIQILDDDAPEYAGKLDFYQYTGSIYHVVPPSRRATKPVGQWNRMRIVAKGREITIYLNDVKIVDADLNHYAKDPEIVKSNPGIQRATGHLGLQSHTDRVDFRNVAVKPT